MRFALAEIEPSLGRLVPGFRELTVRVRPTNSPRPKR